MYHELKPTKRVIFKNYIITKFKCRGLWPRIVFLFRGEMDSVERNIESPKILVIGDPFTPAEDVAA